MSTCPTRDCPYVGGPDFSIGNPCRCVGTRCEVCEGSGEIVKNDHGGDPEWEYSVPCPECSEVRREYDSWPGWMKRCCHVSSGGV